MTLSALPSTCGGIVTRMRFAVFKFFAANLTTCLRLANSVGCPGKAVAASIRLLAIILKTASTSAPSRTSNKCVWISIERAASSVSFKSIAFPGKFPLTRRPTWDSLGRDSFKSPIAFRSALANRHESRYVCARASQCFDKSSTHGVSADRHDDRNCPRRLPGSFD